MNNYSSTDREFTLRALELASFGAGQVSPNPLVGCVITSGEGYVVGEGTYTYDGVTHAEMIALESAGQRARGGTAYVSLEPHDHRNRTEPCTDALIAAGIRRVVCPIEDPNPKVSGRGFAHLRAAGIDVVTGILAEEARRLNEKFICWHTKGRPFIHLKLATSLDGRISMTGSVSTALSGDEARRRVQDLRHEHDAILIGSNTAVIDDPALTDRSGRPRRRPLVRVVLDERLRMSPTSNLAATAKETPTLLYTASHDHEKRVKLEGCGVTVVVLENGSRDLSTVLKDLRSRDIQSVLVEGGSQIAGSFCDQKLVDKTTFIYAPLIIGGTNAPSAVGGAGASDVTSALKLQDLSVEQLGSDVEITGYPSE